MRMVEAAGVEDEAAFSQTQACCVVLPDSSIPALHTIPHHDDRWLRVPARGCGIRGTRQRHLWVLLCRRLRLNIRDLSVARHGACTTRATLGFFTMRSLG